MATKKIISLLLIFMMLLPILAGCADNTEAVPAATEPQLPAAAVTGQSYDASAPCTPEDYAKVCESGTYELWLYEPRMSVMLVDKQTGAVLESTLSDSNDDGAANRVWTGWMKSGLVLSVIQGTNNTYQADLINNANTLDYQYRDNGFDCTVYFTDYGLGLTVNVTLDGEDLLVNVADSSIREDKNNTYIATVSLFPMMGATHMGDAEGYMLVPDGNGAIIYLNDKENRFTTGFSQMIYGKDPGFTDSTAATYLWEEYETVKPTGYVIAPIFGMAHTADQLAYLAIVEQGATRASIEAHPNGALINYNRCFAKFLLRDVYVQPLNQSNSGTVAAVEADRTHNDLTLRYRLLSGGNASYAGMARSYQDYLLSTGELVKKDTGYNTRVDFLGTDRETFMVGTSAVVMTTAEDIGNIYADLQSEGVESLLSVFKGWQSGGIYDVPVSAFHAERKIGGSGKLADLIADSAEANYNLYLYNDMLRVNADTNLGTYSVVKKINKRTLAEKLVAQVYDTFYYLLPDKTAANVASLTASAGKQGVTNFAFSGISNTLFSYYSKDRYYTRASVADTYDAALAGADGSASILLEEPFSYLWKYADAFLDMPLGSSDYMYVDEDIPFLSMVLKGILPMYSDYINFEANKTQFFLQMVESGVYPSFYVTEENSSALIYTNSNDSYSTEYSTYRDTILRYDAELRQVAEAVAGATIVDYIRENGVSQVSYSNGTVIYVNFNEAPASMGGITLDALSYKIQ